MMVKIQKQPILNGNDLAKACDGVLLYQAESMARKFIAEHPEDATAWGVLLNRLDRIGNYSEMQRMAKQADALFPKNTIFKMDYAKALVINGQKAIALEVLQAYLYGLNKLGLEQCLLYAEISLANNPAFSLSAFENVTKHVPNNLFAKLGARAAKSLLKNPNATHQVCFFLSADWHIWVQSSVIDALEQRNIPFTVARQDWIVGLLNPKVVVLSSPNDRSMRVLRTSLPNTQFVNTRHGISINGKNYGLYAAAACDYVCASSEAIASALCKFALLPAERVWTTGYPQMDKLFSVLNMPIQATKINRSRRRVLFAPTFNPDLSAAYLIGEDPIVAIRGDDESIAVALAPHPDLRILEPAMVNRWEKLANKHANAVFMNSSTQNLMDYFPEVDVLVSDVSSVAIQFLATNRPLVKYIDEARVANSNANADDGEEWDITAVSHLVTNNQALKDTVKRLLNEAEPENLLQKRSQLKQMLFGTMTQGNAGKIIAEQIVILLKS